LTRGSSRRWAGLTASNEGDDDRAYDGGQNAASTQNLDHGASPQIGDSKQLSQATPYAVSTARVTVQQFVRNHSNCTYYRVSGLDVIDSEKGSQKNRSGSMI
jgi:hypothetical protein